MTLSTEGERLRYMKTYPFSGAIQLILTNIVIRILYELKIPDAQAVNPYCCSDNLFEQRFVRVKQHNKF
jgi:hypothetical protein